MPKLPSYRNQSIDLESKSIGWFLYDGNFGVYWVNYDCRFSSSTDQMQPLRKTPQLTQTANTCSKPRQETPKRRLKT